MKYDANRDIVKAVRQLKTLSPARIAEWVQDNRTETDKFGRKIQKTITRQAITMFFKRNPDVQKKLANEIADSELNGQVITESLFMPKIFAQIPCVAQWQLKMGGREAKETSKRAFLNALRQVCMGRLPQTKAQVKAKAPINFIEGWGLKHPRKLTVQDGLKYIEELKKTGAVVRNHRLTLRNFFKARNLEGWDDISGKLETQAGKYAHLYVTKDKIRDILLHVKSLNEIAYRASKFAYKTASRMGGVQSAQASKLNKGEHTIWLMEKASRGQPKREVEKFISQDIWEEFGLDNAQGKLFDIDPQALRNILKEAFQAVIPEIAEEIPMPFHFWRHQFAQHGLRATNWNYALIAGLGHWTVETLERYYGKMDRKTRLQGASKFVHML